MADRHAVASGEDENQHEENRMRDIHIGTRRAETTYEEQPESGGGQYDSSKKLRTHQHDHLPLHMCL